MIRDRHTLAQPVWVAFPKSGVARTVRRRVLSVRADEGNDVAVLVLAEPAPAGIRPARLLCPEAADLVGERWWAFGFPADAPFGSDAHGVIGASLAYGWLRLEAEAPRAMKEGFLGAGIWSPRFEAVVGVLGRVHPLRETDGEAVALTLLQAGLDLPEEQLHALAGWSVLDAGESALAAWGWSLDTDAEAGRHWRPRARGVAVESEAGYRFRGRRAALSAVVDWLDRPVLDDRVLVVTGSPGVGKSAVLGRVVTTADTGIRAALPDDDHNVMASVGSVACAVHVKGKTAMDVAVEIARAAAVRLPRAVTELVPALCRRLADRHTPRFNLVLDALDEAVSPDHAQQIVEEIVLPIARTCGAVGAQVVVGTRRSDDGGDLMQLFGPDVAVIDLDSEQFFEVDDLAAYALATLQLAGAERPGNPYADDRIGAPVAARIADLADRNFLVAGLIARRHGVYDSTPIHPNDLSFPPDVDAALEDYVHRLPPVGAAPAKLALTALAYAHAPGLSLDLWQVVLAALGAATMLSDLEEFARSSAANFLVESSGGSAGRRFRLFHQALNDALLRERQQRGTALSDQRMISDRLIRHGRTGGWCGADRYLLRSLPEHAAAGGLIDELLIDDQFLLYADLPRLTPPADYARSILGQQRARLLRLTPQAATAGPAERAAQFSVTAALEGLDARMVVDRSAPYRAAWAAVQRRLEWAILEGHTSAVGTVCALTTRSGRVMLASGGSDGTVRIWNPYTGQQDRVLLAGSAVIALCPVPVGGRTLVASAGADGVIVLWDPDTGQQRHALHCEPGQIRALITVSLAGEACVGIATADGTLTVWDPAAQRRQVCAIHSDKITTVVDGGGGHVVAGGLDGSIEMWELHQFRRRWAVPAHDGHVTALCLMSTPEGDILASAGSDHTVRLWDPVSGQLRSTLDCPRQVVEALCPLHIRGRTILAAADSGGLIRLWDPLTGQQRRSLPDQHLPIRDLCSVDVQGRVLLVSVGDTAVRLWDPDAGAREGGGTAGSAEITALAAVWQGSKEVVACGCGDGSVRLRSAATGDELRVLTGHDGPVTGLSTLFAFGDVMLASSSTDHTIGVWTLNAARQRPHRDYRPGWSDAVSAVFVHRQVFLACAGERGTVRLWDPYTGRERRRHRTGLFRRRAHAHAVGVSALCAIPSRSGTRIASAGHDGTVRIWNLDTGRQELAFADHKGRVRAACALMLRGQELIASAGDDQVIRIWDTGTGVAQVVLQGHTSRVTAVCPVTANGRLLLASTSIDGTARLWNPGTGALELTIPVHHEATACVATGDCLIVGLTAGTLAIGLNL
ncbi:MAG TPA: WD40 repeat domain-containing protein [Actinoplanes sp.]|nr:WD40 repeat domain-containing protein [Actinoplanes sp.]